jgi:hypothetical protein
MLNYFKNNSPLMNTIIVYLFIMYIIFMKNPNVNNELFIVLPTIIYVFCVFLKINN